MAEIVINKRDAKTLDLLTMPQEILAEIISRIAQLKIRNVVLHADWSAAPHYCSWLFAELKEKGIQTTVCSTTVSSVLSVMEYIDQGTGVELSLCQEGQASEQIADTARKLFYFLCVDTPSPDGQLYSEIIKKIPPSAKVTLGINWQTRLAGPSPIVENDYKVWSATIIELVKQLSARKITTIFACGLKLCMFTSEQLGFLPTRLVQWPIAYCARPLFFDIDGSLRPCMLLTLPGTMNFNYKSNLVEATATIESWLEPYLGHCMDAVNLNCRTLKTCACATGCISSTLSEWHIG